MTTFHPSSDPGGEVAPPPASALPPAPDPSPWFSPSPTGESPFTELPAGPRWSAAEPAAGAPPASLAPEAPVSPAIVMPPTPEVSEAAAPGALAAPVGPATPTQPSPQPQATDDLFTLGTVTRSNLPPSGLPPITLPSVDVDPYGEGPRPVNELLPLVDDPGWNRGAHSDATASGPTSTGIPSNFGGPIPPPQPYAAYPPPGYPTAVTGWPPAGFLPPKAWPVAVWTFFFGIFGVISATRRSVDARALGAPTGRYWGAFVGGLVAGFVVWFLGSGIAMAVLVPLYTNYKAEAMASDNVMTSQKLETQLVATAPVNGVKVTGAMCVQQQVDSIGAGTYTCLATLSNGTSQPITVTVNKSGGWVATPRK